MVYKKQSPQKKGKVSEKKALEFFQKQGWKLIAQNQILAGVEVDLILEKPDQYLIVEVKSDNLWRKEYPITIKQKKRLSQAFSVFCEQYEKPVQMQLAIVNNDNNIHILDIEF